MSACPNQHLSPEMAAERKHIAKAFKFDPDCPSHMLTRLLERIAKGKKTDSTLIDLRR